MISTTKWSTTLNRLNNNSVYGAYTTGFTKTENYYLESLLEKIDEIKIYKLHKNLHLFSSYDKNNEFITELIECEHKLEFDNWIKHTLKSKSIKNIVHVSHSKMVQNILNLSLIVDRVTLKESDIVHKFILYIDGVIRTLFIFKVDNEYLFTFLSLGSEIDNAHTLLLSGFQKSILIGDKNIDRIVNTYIPKNLAFPFINQNFYCYYLNSSFHHFFDKEISSKNIKSILSTIKDVKNIENDFDLI